MIRFALVLLLLINTVLVFGQNQTPVTGPPPPPNIHPNTVESSPMLIAKKDAPGRLKTVKLEANNIGENIANDNSYSRFYKAVQQAGLSETFKSAGPITIFLPDNAAFQKMPKGKLDTLMRDDHKLELIAFITYHAIPGKFTAHQLTKQIAKQKSLAKFKTLSGVPLKAKLDAAHNIILIDEFGKESTITQSNIKQSNGMMFIISDVLMSKNHMI